MAAMGRLPSWEFAHAGGQHISIIERLGAVHALRGQVVDMGVILVDPPAAVTTDAALLIKRWLKNNFLVLVDSSTN